MQGKNKTKIILITLAIIIFTLLVCGIFYGAYYFIKENVNFSAPNTASEQKEGKRDKPKVDVLSSQFSNDFMHADRRDGYANITKGIKRDSLENELGSPDDKIKVDDVRVWVYGNVGVNFKDDEVNRVFIVPQKITVQEFQNYHGSATIHQADGALIYDDNTSNSYTIKVYADKEGKIEGIENIDQLR
ncbi:hypothetical protein K2V59_08575 [Staphylococcus arlettae]|uniref:hypothetical protein n=1 Tax=Staphylococcus arlettae TaxID=29378 RepID=UPI001E3244CD|nr:hypothetical protein [Staphylococcus arlettae]MCD8889593.1 hypothetical protein [Staphylococcus arlettae]